MQAGFDFNSLALFLSLSLSLSLSLARARARSLSLSRCLSLPSSLSFNSLAEGVHDVGGVHGIVVPV